MNQSVSNSITNNIRILLVDDHALFRQGLRRILESEKDFTIVGEAYDGDNALEIAGALSPDIILMDISMPNCNGIEASQKIKQMLPLTGIILLTMHEDLFLQREGKNIGVSGYVLKKSADKELIDAIRKVYSGQTFFLSQPDTPVTVSSDTMYYDILSAREKEMLRLLANGMTNIEISRHACISVNTVETHRKNIMKKLKLHSLSEIIKFALVHGLIQR
ncbi:MAG: response regulator transcription factor [Nitrospirae bacterium]|nr:response regulator transcription factor [Nitrospirota bacterium]